MGRLKLCMVLKNNIQDPPFAKDLRHIGDKVDWPYICAAITDFKPHRLPDEIVEEFDFWICSMF